jgi:hypothetical protein
MCNMKRMLSVQIGLFCERLSLLKCGIFAIGGKTTYSLFSEPHDLYNKSYNI